jgi:hypothetical protein
MNEWIIDTAAPLSTILRQPSSLTLSFSKQRATASLTFKTLSSSNSLSLSKALLKISLALFDVANADSNKAAYSLTYQSPCFNKFEVICKRS